MQRFSAIQAIHGGGVRKAAQEFGMPERALIDFSANINPFAPLFSDVDWGRWRKQIEFYPEPEAESVALKLAELYGCEPSQILPTAGAIEGLYLVARLFAGAKPAMIEPAFSDYGRAFAAAGSQAEHIVLEPASWCQPAEAWADLLAPYSLVVLGNPNNPTGSLQSRRQLEALFKCLPNTAWIVDEAFIEFVPDPEKQTLLEVLCDYRVVVLRSLTKSWAIPGLRLGFVASANRAWMDSLRAMQPPWSINAVAAAWANDLLTGRAHQQLKLGLEQLRQSGIRFAAALGQIDGLRVYPSACNFLLLEIMDPQLDADTLYQRLGKRGFLVRVCDSFHGMPPGRFIRLAVRSDEENERFVKELATVCSSKPRMEVVA